MAQLSSAQIASINVVFLSPPSVLLPSLLWLFSCDRQQTEWLTNKIHSGLIIHIYNFAAAAIYSSSNLEFGLAEEVEYTRVW
jgi:hypothetical protein